MLVKKNVKMFIGLAYDDIYLFIHKIVKRLYSCASYICMHNNIFFFLNINIKTFIVMSRTNGVVKNYTYVFQFIYHFPSKKKK